MKKIINTKILMAILAILFLRVSNIKAAIIVGQSCVDILNSNVTYAINVTADQFVWSLGSNAKFSSNNSGSITTTSASVPVQFLATGTTSITCQVWRNDPNNNNNLSLVDGASLSISVRNKIGAITGTTSILNPGQYSYSIPPVSGASSYVWTFPSGWSGSSVTNSIALTAGTSAVSGNVIVTVVGGNLCAQSKSVAVYISKCYNKSQGQYNAPSVTNKVVSGDFNRDGKEDDIAGFYDYGSFNTTIHVWKSNGSQFSYQGDNGWWSSSQYNAAKLVAVVSGDFNRDGFNDDIAGFYDYGNFLTECHVWISSGGSFSFSSRWTGTSYDATRIAGRVVALDFNRDGKKDDIAAIYDYNTFEPQCHVWVNNGSTFSATAKWTAPPSSYDAKKITGRFVSGDFNRDGFENEIAAFYNYPNFQTQIHVWSSNGSVFSYPATWYNNTSYDATKVTGRVVSGDFDRDGFKDDISAFYDYSNFNTTIHTWESTGSSFSGPSTAGWWSSGSYDPSKITGRVVSGDFNSDGKKDNIAALYDYTNFNTSWHEWNTNGASFSYVGDIGFWSVCNPNSGRYAVASEPLTTTEEENEVPTIESIASNEMFNFYPNPTNGELFVNTKIENALVELFDMTGKKVIEERIKSNNAKLDISMYPKGIYFISVSNGIQIEREKLVFN